MDALFVVSIFRLYNRLKLTYTHNSVRKNLFLSTCYCLDDQISLRKMDQQYPHGGIIGYGDSYLDPLFRYSKVFRLHAILLDAAGVVRTQSGTFLNQEQQNMLHRARRGREAGCC